MDRQAASRTGAVAEGGAMTAPSPARFSAEDRAVLLAVKGVGPTVLERLETLGIASMEALARSEEHTSELQSLMRISYAVFCLKKKIINNHRTSTEHLITR